MAKSFEKLIGEYESNVNEDIKKRTQFIQDQVEKAWMKGVVVGISGGIDSAVAAALAIRSLGPSKVLGVWMPAYSDPIHEKDAFDFANAIGLKILTVNLDRTTDDLINRISTGLRDGEMIKEGQQLSIITTGNTKARERMAVLYAIANQLGYLVMGTCNRTEIHLGYETKGGDQICDFNPVASLLKTQIRILARELGVPENIINKEPSADLWEGHTDEGEMGFTYKDADKVILTGEGDPDIIKKVEQLHRYSEHKRRPQPVI